MSSLLEFQTELKKATEIQREIKIENQGLRKEVFEVNAFLLPVLSTFYFFHH